MINKKPVMTPTIKIALIVGAIVFTCFGTCITSVLMQDESPERSRPSTSSQPSEPSDPVETWRDKDNTWLARGMTKDFVKKNLKSPSTAKFPGVLDGWGDHTTYIGDQRYKTVSWVDAQNNFGATVRMNYTAIVEQTGKDTWRLESLVFDQ